MPQLVKRCYTAQAAGLLCCRQRANPCPVELLRQVALPKSKNTQYQVIDWRLLAGNRQTAETGKERLPNPNPGSVALKSISHQRSSYKKTNTKAFLALGFSPASQISLSSRTASDPRVALVRSEYSPLKLPRSLGQTRNRESGKEYEVKFYE